MKRNVFLMIMVCAFGALSADAATVLPRNSRASLSRMPTVSAQSLKTNITTTQTNAVTDESEIDDTPIVENKSTRFDEALNDALEIKSDVGANELAEKIRAQRAALDAADARAATIDATNVARASGRNACDAGLRSCMTEKCGNNFAKCASDTDTTFGTKLESCRRNLKCNANEFKLFSAEIKSDRDAAIQLKSFNDIIDCGQNYDTCIINECGNKYSKCLGKTAGDTAISKCNSIAQRCIAMDSGLANRTMNVFATLRQTAEKQIVTDEKQLYALRDQMKSICSRLGAMFDERSLDCVYTVNFYAGNDSTLYASKKAYAGGTFDCTPNWFGVDVTTFKENAYRLTREQTSASSAMLGSGVGMAVGAVTSGAISNAIDAQKARRAAEEAKETKVETETEQQLPPKAKYEEERREQRPDKKKARVREEKASIGEEISKEDLDKDEVKKIIQDHVQDELDTTIKEQTKEAARNAEQKAGSLKSDKEVQQKRAAAKAAASSGSSSSESSGSSSSGGSSSDGGK